MYYSACPEILEDCLNFPETDAPLIIAKPAATALPVKTMSSNNFLFCGRGAFRLAILNKCGCCNVPGRTTRALAYKNSLDQSKAHTRVNYRGRIGLPRRTRSSWEAIPTPSIRRQSGVIISDPASPSSTPSLRHKACGSSLQTLRTHPEQVRLLRCPWASHSGPSPQEKLGPT